MIHSTNYYDTLIDLAEDCPSSTSEEPPVKAKPSVANYQFETIKKSPYKWTSDDVIFGGFARRNDIPDSEYEDEKDKFFAKGQACLRASPLPKRYGWAIHHNSEGKVALIDVSSEQYQTLMNDPKIKKVRAMRSSRK